jgi:hypothetical protein
MVPRHPSFLLKIKIVLDISLFLSLSLTGEEVVRTLFTGQREREREKEGGRERVEGRERKRKGEREWKGERERGRERERKRGRDREKEQKVRACCKHSCGRALAFLIQSACVIIILILC